MSERTFPDMNRVEPGAFQEDFCSRIFHAAFQSAEDTCDTHGFFFIADHQVFRGQFAFFSIKGHERCTFAQGFYDHFPSLYFRCVKRVKRLTGFVQYEIGDVYNIINTPHTDCT
jgi:hypothetical protein